MGIEKQLFTSYTPSPKINFWEKVYDLHWRTGQTHSKLRHCSLHTLHTWCWLIVNDSVSMKRNLLRTVWMSYKEDNGNMLEAK